MDSKRSVYKTAVSKGNNIDNIDLKEVFLVVPQEGDAEILADVYENSCRRSCNCLRTIFCCFAGKGGNDEVFETVGRLLAQFFQELDVTTDDMLLGIRLVQIEQRTQERQKIVNNLTQNEAQSSKDISNLNEQQDQPENTVSGNNSHVIEIGSSKSEKETVKLLQKRTSKRYYDQSSESNEAPFGATNADIEIFREIQYYYKYALGIYGHLLYIYKSYGFLPGACDIVCCSNACCCCAKGNSAFESPRSCFEKTCNNCVDSTTCFGANYAGMVKTFGVHVKKEDILYVSFAQSFISSPFALVIDHLKKTIVLTVRGTMSLDDCVKDVIAIAHPLDDIGQTCWGFSAEGAINLYCHKGMYDTAVDIKNRLEEKGLIPYFINDDNGDMDVSNNNKGKKKYNDDDARKTAKQLRSSSLLLSSCKGYEMIITGHSLGAGIATILTLMLHKKLPRVRGIVYSPPPCLSAPLVKYTRNFITAVSVGGDFVGRLSPQNMSRMKRRMVALLQATNVEKYRVLCSFICRHSVALHDFVDPSKMNDIDNWSQLSDEEVSLPLKPYYLPGKLIHLALKSRKQPRCPCWPGCLYETCCDPEREYEPRWILDNTKAMQEILIHSRMTADHFPDTIEKTLSGKYVSNLEH
eukprot:g7817.t1